MRFEKPGQPVWWSLVMVLAAMLAVAVAGVMYTGFVDRKREAAEREADRRWCTLLVLIDDNSQRNPPTTETGREYYRIIHALRISLGCELDDVNPLPGLTTPTR